MTKTLPRTARALVRGVLTAVLLLQWLSSPATAQTSAGVQTAPKKPCPEEQYLSHLERVTNLVGDVDFVIRGASSFDSAGVSYSSNRRRQWRLESGGTSPHPPKPTQGVYPPDDPCPPTESETNNLCSSVETLTVPPETLACICEIELKPKGQSTWQGYR
jgi:hypothetical protein